MWASLFSLSGPCSRGCRAAWALASIWGWAGISRLSTVWPLPVLLRAGREHAFPCWGWCGFRAWWRRGVGDDGTPRDCTRFGCGHGVSLCSCGVGCCGCARVLVCTRLALRVAARAVYVAADELCIVWRASRSLGLTGSVVWRYDIGVG